MKKVFFTSLVTFLLLIGCTFGLKAQNLVLTGVFDGPLSGGVPKAIELYVANDIADLSVYGISVASNGAASAGSPAYSFPADAVTAGTYLYVASEQPLFNSYFGFDPDYTYGGLTPNGDDVIELYLSGSVYDVYGVIGEDGTGMPWEYLDGWAYRNGYTAPASTFTLSDWTLSGINATDGETTNATATSQFPTGTFTMGGGALAFPFVEPFETWPLTNWTIEGTSAYVWESNDGTSYGPGSVFEGTLAAMFDVYSASSGNTTTMTTDVIDASGATSPILIFQYWMDGFADTDLWVKAEMSTNGSTWTEVFYMEQDGTIGDWTEANVNLTGANATTQVRIIGSSDYGSFNLYVDDLQIKEAPTATLTWCNLQFPGTHTMLANENVDVYAQAYEAGITDANPAAAGTGVECWFGYSMTNDDPSTWITWMPAAYAGADVGNNDEFMLNVSGLPAGTYYYASRWRLDGGPYTYGGFVGGFWDGTTNVNGELTVNAVPGSDCSNPIIVDIPTDLTYNHISTTCGLGDNYNLTTSYDNGEDAIYRLDITSNTVIKITMATATTWTGLFLFDGCPDTGSLINSVENSGSADRVITEALTVGTYYVMLDIYPSPDCFAYDLTIEEVCLAPSSVEAINMTSTTADIQWVAGGFETDWNLKVSTITIDPTSVGGDVFDAVVATTPLQALGSLNPDTDYYVYVQSDCLGDWSVEYMFTTPLACPTPTNLDAVFDASEATLSWDELGATDWILEVSTTPLTDPSTETGDVLDDVSVSGGVGEYLLTPLTGNTTYYWYVMSDCGTGVWSAEGMFTTLCDAISLLPWTEDFEGVTTPDLPSCWMQIDENADGDFWKTWTGNGVGGSQAAGIYTDINGGDNDDYLILPSFVLTGNEQLKYFVKAYSSGEPNDYRVVLSTTGNAPADFTEELIPLTEVSSTTMTEVTPIDLSAYSGQVYIAMHIPNGGLDGWYIYFDDFTVEEIPTCPIPTDLFVDGITSTSAFLNWTENGTAVAWNIKGSDTPIDPEVDPGDYIAPMGTNPFEVTMLTPNTTYYWYIQADCGGTTSNWSVEGEFTTECATFSSPFLETFDTYEIECWSEGQGIIADPTIFTDGTSAWSSSVFANAGTDDCVKINNYGTTRDEWMFTPTINLGDGSVNYYLTFDLALTDYYSTDPPTAAPDDVFAVVISLDNGATWSSANNLMLWDNIGSPNVYDNINTTGELVSIDLGAYTDEVIFGFYAESTISNGDNDLFIDNLQVRELSDENDILTFSFAQQTGPATIGAGTINIEVSMGTNPNGLVPTFTISDFASVDFASGDSQNFSTDFDYTVTSESLIPQTWTVSVTVAAIASDQKDILTFSLPEETGPAAIGANTVDIEVAWNADLAALTPTITISDLATIDPASGVEGDFSTFPVVYTVTAEDISEKLYDVTVTQEAIPAGATCGTAIDYGTVNDPEMTGTMASYETVWYTFTTTQPYANVILHTCGTDFDTKLAVFDDCAAYSTIEEYGAPAGNMGYNDDDATSYCSVDNNQSLISYDVLPAGTYYVVLYPFDTSEPVGDYALEILGDADACLVPTNLAYSDLLQEEVTLTWDAGFIETDWNIIYGQTGFNVLTEGTTINSVSSPYYLTMLTADTEYDVYVQAICSGPSTSDWSDVVTFTTPSVCPVPTGLDALVLGTSDATLTWDELGTVDWVIEVSTTPLTDPSTETGDVEDNTDVFGTVGTFDLTLLDANTTYYWYVMSTCGSDWSAEGMFTTDCDVVSTFPFIEEFESGVPPTCWYELRTPTSSYGWETNADGVSGSCARFNSWLNSNGNISTLSSITFDLTSLSTPILKIDYKNPTGGDFTVRLSTDGGITYPNVLQTGLTGQSSWTTITSDLTSYIGSNVKIALVGTSNYGSGDAYIYLDNFTVLEMPEIDQIDINSDATDVYVCTGTLEADAIAQLASQITITDTDANEYLVDVTWTIDTYDGATDGDYNATGTFVLPDGVLQTDPATTLEVTAVVTIGAAAEAMFSFGTVYCVGSAPDELPTTSDDGFTGTWSPATIVTEDAGDIDYTFTPDASQCALETTISVTMNARPIVICPETMNIAVDEPVAFTGHDPIGGVFTGIGVVGDTFDPNTLVNDTYVITYTYVDPITTCEDSCQFNVIVDIPSNLNNVSTEGIGIYPNPNNGDFTINFKGIEGDVTYQVYDTKGSIIILEEISTDGNTVKEVAMDLAPGVYYVKIVTTNQTYVEKLVVE